MWVCWTLHISAQLCILYSIQLNLNNLISKRIFKRRTHQRPRKWWREGERGEESESIVYERCMHNCTIAKTNGIQLKTDFESEGWVREVREVDLNILLSLTPSLITFITHYFTIFNYVLLFSLFQCFRSSHKCGHCKYSNGKCFLKTFILCHRHSSYSFFFSFDFKRCRFPAKRHRSFRIEHLKQCHFYLKGQSNWGKTKQNKHLNRCPYWSSLNMAMLCLWIPAYLWFFRSRKKRKITSAINVIEKLLVVCTWSNPFWVRSLESRKWILSACPVTADSKK